MVATSLSVIKHLSHRNDPLKIETQIERGREVLH